MSGNKKLKGIQYTPELKKLVKECVGNINGNNNSKNTTTNDAIQQHESTSKQGRPMDSTKLIVEFNKIVPDPDALPLNVLCAIRTILPSEQVEAALKSSFVHQQQSNALVFAQEKQEQEREMTTQEKKERLRFQKRLERLRLRAEEARYQKLTTNLAQMKQDDDVTAKSMTFAASVGLNMIVAPISFGVFMYFFSGQLFSNLLPDNNNNNKGPDIKRVIVGVISGVAMLFVEMLLFVIRTHTLEKSVSQKKRRGTNRVGPFGFTRPTATTDMKKMS